MQDKNNKTHHFRVRDKNNILKYKTQKIKLFLNLRKYKKNTEYKIKNFNNEIGK